MIDDPAALFWRAQRLMPPEFLRERFGVGQWLFRNVFGMLPVAKAGEGYWQPRDWRTARSKDWRIVMAIRCGDPFEGEADPAWLERDPVSRCPTEASRLTLLGMRALHGPDIIDLVCWPDWAMRRAPLRLTGMARAIGGAIDDLDWSDRAETDVLVVRDIHRWISRCLDGACLPLGTADEQATLLRSFTGGVRTEGVQHGLALEKLMLRPAPAIPKISVEAGEEAA
jgi:hypothetical protein